MLRKRRVLTSIKDDRRANSNRDVEEYNEKLHSDSHFGKEEVVGWMGWWKRDRGDLGDPGSKPSYYK